jgi:cardiolipin synthase
LRIFLLIPFAIYYSNEEYLIAMIILVVSGITDIVDGFIARHFNMITTVGKVLDPLADKITQVSVAICIAFNNTFIMPTLIIFCIKELLMLIGSFVLLRKGLRPSESKWWGKVGTVVIYAYL